MGVVYNSDSNLFGYQASVSDKGSIIVNIFAHLEESSENFRLTRSQPSGGSRARNLLIRGEVPGLPSCSGEESPLPAYQHWFVLGMVRFLVQYSFYQSLLEPRTKEVKKTAWSKYLSVLEPKIKPYRDEPILDALNFSRINRDDSKFLLFWTQFQSHWKVISSFLDLRSNFCGKWVVKYFTKCEAAPGGDVGEKLAEGRETDTTTNKDTHIASLVFLNCCLSPCFPSPKIKFWFC